MARPVVWAQPAVEDVEGIAQFVARDSPVYASRLVLEVTEAAASLSDYPERGHIVPERGLASIREMRI